MFAWCTGGVDAAMMDDTKLLRKSAKRILTGTELISIGLEPYRAQSVVLSSIALCLVFESGNVSVARRRLGGFN